MEKIFLFRFLFVELQSFSKQTSWQGTYSSFHLPFILSISFHLFIYLSFSFHFPLIISLTVYPLIFLSSFHFLFIFLSFLHNPVFILTFFLLFIPTSVLLFCLSFFYPVLRSSILSLILLSGSSLVYPVFYSVFHSFILCFIFLSFL